MRRSTSAHSLGVQILPSLPGRRKACNQPASSKQHIASDRCHGLDGRFRVTHGAFSARRFPLVRAGGEADTSTSESTRFTTRHAAGTRSLASPLACPDAPQSAAAAGRPLSSAAPCWSTEAASGPGTTLREQPRRGAQAVEIIAAAAGWSCRAGRSTLAAGLECGEAPCCRIRAVSWRAVNVSVGGISACNSKPLQC